MFLQLTRLSIVLAFVVVLLGAYTRLSDAGLGCPDWPGCYGKVVVPQAEKQIDQSNHVYASWPLQRSKAWKEMIHRYAAGSLGILILVIAGWSWKNRSQPGQQVIIPLALVGLVVLQALLGMWTVTLLLKPVIVLCHLLGGMSILALLFWIHLKARYSNVLNGAVKSPLWPWALIALLVVYIQISLGGWTSANYAALICPDLPVCQGQWWPHMNFSSAFLFWHHASGGDYEYGVLNGPARTAIQVSHRMGAVVTLLTVGSIAIRSIRDPNRRIKHTGIVMLLVLIMQFSLGITNILLKLPIQVAVSHNGGAALLLLSTVALLFHTRYSSA